MYLNFLVLIYEFSLQSGKFYSVDLLNKPFFFKSNIMSQGYVESQDWKGHVSLKNNLNTIIIFVFSNAERIDYFVFKVENIQIPFVWESKMTVISYIKLKGKIQICCYTK